MTKVQTIHSQNSEKNTYFIAFTESKLNFFFKVKVCNANECFGYPLPSELSLKIAPRTSD